VEIRPIVNLGLMRNDAPTDNSGDTVKLAALEMGVASGIVGIVDQTEGAHLSAAAGGHGWPGAIHPGSQTSDPLEPIGQLSWVVRITSR
jgi:hypothetical protein